MAVAGWNALAIWTGGIIYRPSGRKNNLGQVAVTIVVVVECPGRSIGKNDALDNNLSPCNTSAIATAGCKRGFWYIT